MPFQSQSQWRWAFANKKPFADQWARETKKPFQTLPKRKKASTGGDFSAGAGQQITGNRCRDANGQWAPCDEVQGETNADPTSSMAAWQMAQEQQRVISLEQRKLRKQALLEKLGLRAPKGTSGKISAAERKRQARIEQKKNEDATHAAVGPGQQLGAALSAFADPDNPGMLGNLTANQLAEYGLVEMGKLGRPYLTAEGRAYLSAARSGDQFAAREAFQRAREGYQAKLEQDQKRQEQEQFDALIQQIEGTPQERRLRLAQERANKLANPKQPKAPKAPKQPSENVSYGSGKVIAGSPTKSTVKSDDEDDEMKYYPPVDVLRAMVTGNDLANHYSLNLPNQYYAEKAISGSAFTIEDIERMYQLHSVSPSFKSTDNAMTPQWVSQQLLGGAAGFYWIDSVMQSFQAMMRLKEVSDEDRRPSLSASVEAIRGLDLQHHFNRGGSPGMIKLGRKIANRDALSDEEIRAMHKYLIDNQDSDHKGDPVNPSVAYINWQIHGADEGLEWSRDAVARLINETFKEEKVDMVPSQSAATTAMRGLDLHHYFKRGGSSDMLAIARKIANKKELDPEDVRKMHTYLKTHENDDRDGNPSNPSVSYINWMLHGGEDGVKWVNDRIDRLRMSRTKIKEKNGINFSPPQGARSAAKRGLELRDKFNRGGTAVGVARARDLSNGKNMSPSTIRRMNSFFARHAVDKRPNWSDPSKPSNGYIAHLLWGGDSGRAWAGKVSRQLDARKKEHVESFKHLRGRHNQEDHSPTGRPAVDRGGGGGGGGGGGRSGGSGSGGRVTDTMILGNTNRRRTEGMRAMSGRRGDLVLANQSGRDNSGLSKADIFLRSYRNNVASGMSTEDSYRQAIIDSGDIPPPRSRSVVPKKRTPLSGGSSRPINPRPRNNEDDTFDDFSMPVPSPRPTGPRPRPDSAGAEINADDLVLANRRSNRSNRRDADMQRAEMYTDIIYGQMLRDGASERVADQLSQEFGRKYAFNPEKYAEEIAQLMGYVNQSTPDIPGMDMLAQMIQDEMVQDNSGDIPGVDILRGWIQDQIDTEESGLSSPDVDILRQAIDEIEGRRRPNDDDEGDLDASGSYVPVPRPDGSGPDSRGIEASAEDFVLANQRRNPNQKINRNLTPFNPELERALGMNITVPKDSLSDKFKKMTPSQMRKLARKLMDKLPKKLITYAHPYNYRGPLPITNPETGPYNDKYYWNDIFVNNPDFAEIVAEERRRAASEEARRLRAERQPKRPKTKEYSRGSMIQQRRNAVSTSFKGKNKPTDPALWSRAIGEAKKRFRVYPSAYANGWASKWYKKHGGGWKTEKSYDDVGQSSMKDLRDWFKEDWVDISRPKKDGGYEPCGRKTAGMSEAEYRSKYPKCVPSSVARTMTERQKRSAINRKRDQGKPQGGKPTMISTIVRKPQK